jgi:hypothetical protein
MLPVCCSVSTNCHYVDLTTHCCSQWSDIYMCLVCLKGNNVVSLTGLICVKCNCMEHSYSQPEEG